MIEAELPDGTVLEFPAGTPPEVVQRAVRQRLGVTAPAAQAPAAPAPAPEPSVLRQTLGGLGNLVAGGVRGAGSIGATLLAPFDVAEDLLAGKGLTLQRNRERRQAMDEGLRSMGADPESLLYKGGKIASEVAGTAGVGGVLAAPLQSAGRFPALAQALRSGGMSSGASMPTRVAGGAATGAASAGLVNPEDAGAGVVIGGALPAALRVARAGVGAATNAVGATSGAGEQALKTAYQAGRTGGAQGQAFRENMRGQADITNVLDDARANLETMRQARAAEYRTNMAPITQDLTVLDLAPIEQTVQKSIDNFTFKGQARNPQVLNALEEVRDAVATWKQLNPADYHTPEGLDALKQQIGAIKNKQGLEATDVRKAIGDVYTSVKQQIEAQAPDYAKAMKDYAQASDLLDEITRSLSLGNRFSADTAMRKLQSVMRNNVNTNYGARLASLQELEQQGGRPLMPALAGQALNDWMPRGIQRATGAGLSLGAGSLGGLPAAAGTAAISSPRLMGEAAYLAGQADPIIRALRRGAQLTAPVLGAQ